MRTLRLFAIIAILVATLSLKTSFGQSSCLVAEYKLDGDAKDRIGLWKNGTLHGTTSTNDRFGKPKSALLFDGSTDYVQLGTNADFPQRTISVWFKVDVFSIKFGIVFTVDHVNLKYGGTGITVDNSGGVNRINGGVGGNVLRLLNTSTNKWYHYAIVVNSSQVICYCNGKFLDSMPNISFTHSTNGDSLAHLGNSRVNENYFKGNIDDLRIYNCALSGDEIKILYNTASIFHQNPTRNLRIYPNPAHEKIIIENGSTSTKGRVTVYNVHGQLMMETDNLQPITEIDIAGFAKGVYCIKVENADGTFLSRIVKD